MRDTVTVDVLFRMMLRARLPVMEMHRLMSGNMCVYLNNGTGCDVDAFTHRVELKPEGYVVSAWEIIEYGEWREIGRFKTARGVIRRLSRQLF